MTDIVAALVLIALLAGAVTYIVRQKRAGVKCVGCAAGRECAERAKAAQVEGGCGCGCSGGCDAVERMLAGIEKATAQAL